MNPLGVPIGFAGGTGLNSIAEVRAEAEYAAKAGFQRYIDAGATELRIAVAAPDEATEQHSRQAIAEWINS